MSVANHILEAMTKASWIRKMFEKGAELKRMHGAENVFDFTLGNPILEPPDGFYDALKELASRRGEGLHGYMPNAGFPSVRRAVASKLAGEGTFRRGSETAREVRATTPPRASSPEATP